MGIVQAFREPRPVGALAQSWHVDDKFMCLASPGELAKGNFIQIEDEILEIRELAAPGQYTVRRVGSHPKQLGCQIGSVVHYLGRTVEEDE